MQARRFIEHLLAILQHLGGRAAAEIAVSVLAQVIRERCRRAP